MILSKLAIDLEENDEIVVGGDILTVDHILHHYNPRSVEISTNDHQHFNFKSNQRVDIPSQQT